MARVTVEDCLDKVTSRFALVLLVSRRTKQIMKGSELTVPLKGNKYVVGALREIAAGNVVFDYDLSRGAPEKQVEEDLNKKQTIHSGKNY